MKVFYPLEDLKRPGSFGRDYRFCELHFTDKEKAEYLDTELLNITVKINAKEKGEGLYIAAVIKNKDNTRICLSGISQSFALEQGANTVHVSIPLNLLEEDLYRLHLELIAFNVYGKSFTYDNSFTSFPFQVNKSIDTYIWPIEYYGNVREQGIIAEVIGSQSIEQE